MQKILKLFNKSGIIKNHTILEYRSSSNAQYLKAKIELQNGDLLFIKEYISATEHSYSYQWQNLDGDLKIRWENAPHHRHISTFPHHKHSPDLEESYETTFEDILKIITEILKK